MEQIVRVSLGGEMFLAIVADFEMRDNLRAGGYGASPRQIRVLGLIAGALVTGMAVLIRILLAASGS